MTAAPTPLKPAPTTATDLRLPWLPLRAFARGPELIALQTTPAPGSATCTPCRPFGAAASRVPAAHALVSLLFGARRGGWPLALRVVRFGHASTPMGEQVKYSASAADVPSMS